MIHLPPELSKLISETDHCLLAITLLRCRNPLTTAELRQLALLRARLVVLCPAERYAWKDGLPICDILKTLHKQNEMEVQL